MSTLTNLLADCGGVPALEKALRDRHTPAERQTIYWWNRYGIPKGRILDIQRALAVIGVSVSPEEIESIEKSKGYSPKPTPEPETEQRPAA